MLSERTHRDLELIARAHDLPFTRRESKTLGLAKLTEALENRAFQKALNSLTSDEIVPLQALQVAGGWLPAYLFQHHFGEIRRYKPWKTSPPALP